MINDGEEGLIRMLERMEIREKTTKSEKEIRGN